MAGVKEDLLASFLVTTLTKVSGLPPMGESASTTEVFIESTGKAKEIDKWNPESPKTKLYKLFSIPLAKAITKWANILTVDGGIANQGLSADGGILKGSVSGPMFKEDTSSLDIDL